MANINKINALIEELGASERITKAHLSVLSRSILEYIMIDDGNQEGVVGINATGSEDSQVANRLLEILTPVNRKVTTLFFKHFMPFFFDEETLLFKGKNKGQWPKKLLACRTFLADPHQNIWSWAERNVQHEVKPYSVETVVKTVKSLITKCKEAGIGNDEVVKAMLEGGITANEIVAVLGFDIPEEQAA